MHQSRGEGGESLRRCIKSCSVAVALSKTFLKSGGGAEAAVDPAGGQREAAERRQSAENVWGQVWGGVSPPVIAS